MTKEKRERRAGNALECRFCGKTFHSSKAWAQYCSVDCRLKAFYLRKAEAIKREPAKRAANPKS